MTAYKPTRHTEAQVMKAIAVGWRRCLLYAELCNTTDAKFDEGLSEAWSAFNPGRAKDVDRLLFDWLAQWELELRALPYAEYLRSDEWQIVRDFALERAEKRCQLCNEDAPLQIHHRTYARRGAEALADVVALCGPCHQLFHEHRRVDQ